MGANVVPKPEEIRKLEAMVKKAHDMALSDASAFHANISKQIKDATKRVKDMADGLYDVEKALKADKKTLDARTATIRKLLK